MGVQGSIVLKNRQHVDVTRRVLFAPGDAAKDDQMLQITTYFLTDHGGDIVERRTFFCEKVMYLSHEHVLLVQGIEVGLTHRSPQQDAVILEVFKGAVCL